jgi:hypothetical protein
VAHLFEVSFKRLDVQHAFAGPRACDVFSILGGVAGECLGRPSGGGQLMLRLRRAFNHPQIPRRLPAREDAADSLKMGEGGFTRPQEPRLSEAAFQHHPLGYLKQCVVDLDALVVPGRPRPGLDSRFWNTLSRGVERRPVKSRVEAAFGVIEDVPQAYQLPAQIRPTFSSCQDPQDQECAENATKDVDADVV